MRKVYIVTLDTNCNEVSVNLADNKCHVFSTVEKAKTFLLSKINELKQTKWFEKRKKNRHYGITELIEDGIDSYTFSVVNDKLFREVLIFTLEPFSIDSDI